MKTIGVILVAAVQLITTMASAQSQMATFYFDKAKTAYNAGELSWLRLGNI